jgi:hypothetical protein
MIRILLMLISLILTLTMAVPAGAWSSARRAETSGPVVRHFGQVPVRPVAGSRAVPVIPPFPPYRARYDRQYYIKAHDGSAIPVVPVFIVPVAPAPEQPRCSIYFCD